MRKSEPRWTIAFLRALERTGEVRSAAEDAGVDHSTAYARRRAHPAFAAAWAEALGRFAAAKALGEAAAVAEVWRLPLSPLAYGESPSALVQGGGDVRPLSPLAYGESPSPLVQGGGAEGELVASGSQVRRSGAGRWNAAREKAFFEELAATANVRRSAKAAGVSANAVFARRLKHPAFRAKWEAVLATARQSIDMYLVEASNRTFDPEAAEGGLDTGEVTPKVSVAEAIRIVQLHGSKKQQDELLPDPFAEEAAAMSREQIDEVRERLVRKLQRMKKRDMPEMLAQGWAHDEEHDQMVPPGWVRAEDRAGSGRTGGSRARVARGRSGE